MLGPQRAGLLERVPELLDPVDEALKAVRPTVWQVGALDDERVVEEAREGAPVHAIPSRRAKHVVHRPRLGPQSATISPCDRFCDTLCRGRLSSVPLSPGFLS